MKTVPREVSEAVIAEFRNVSAAAQSVSRGGVRYAQQLLEQALGPARAKVVLEKIQERVVDTGLKRLKKAAPEVLAGILRGEHPQTVALILAHLEESQAAALVAAIALRPRRDYGRQAVLPHSVPYVARISPWSFAARSSTKFRRRASVHCSPASMTRIVSR